MNEQKFRKKWPRIHAILKGWQQGRDASRSETAYRLLGKTGSSIDGPRRETKKLTRSKNRRSKPLVVPAKPVQHRSAVHPRSAGAAVRGYATTINGYTDGMLVASHQRFASRQDYDRASVGLARGGQVTGAAQAEHEFSGPDGRRVLLKGRQLLATLAAVATMDAGSRFIDGVYPINPEALGGRPSILAAGFEQHRARSLRVVYKPSVPATTVGALLLYFRQDIGTPNYTTGVNELMHASTHPAFVQTQVWEEAGIDIHPDDALRRYFDDGAGDMRMKVQGIVQAEAASFLSAGAFGNLYIEYEYEFFGEQLDYEVNMIDQGSVNLTWTSTSVIDGYPVYGVVSGAIGGKLTAVVSGPGSYDDMVFIGTVVSTNMAPVFGMPDDREAHLFKEGQTFFVTFGGEDEEKQFILWSNLADAGSGFQTLDSSVLAGQLLYAITTTANGQVDLSGRWVPLRPQAP